VRIPGIRRRKLHAEQCEAGLPAHPESLREAKSGEVGKMVSLRHSLDVLTCACFTRWARDLFGRNVRSQQWPHIHVQRRTRCTKGKRHAEPSTRAWAGCGWLTTACNLILVDGQEWLAAEFRYQRSCTPDHGHRFSQVRRKSFIRTDISGQRKRHAEFLGSLDCSMEVLGMDWILARKKASQTTSSRSSVTTCRRFLRATARWKCGLTLAMPTFLLNGYKARSLR
jgi:hypothetical protein